MELTSTVSLIHMWATFFFIALTILLYIWEKLPIELSSVLALASMITLFHLMPLKAPDGTNMLDAHALLAGFANPALITVLSLIIVGQALVATGALNQLATRLTQVSRGRSVLAFVLILTGVCAIAAFLNNTPVVVIFIPILIALAGQSAYSLRQVMMPLSFVSILGGMTTLIGSSTNLLVSRSLTELGMEPLHFFEFTPIAVILAAIGLGYALFILPRLLGRESVSGGSLLDTDGKQFLAHLHLPEGCALIGAKPVSGHFSDLPNVTVLMILRGPDSFYPPFDQTPLEPGDILVVAATREILTSPGLLELGLVPEEQQAADAKGMQGASAHRQVVEAMITPGSRLTGGTIRGTRFENQYRCLVIGLKRRAHMARSSINEIRLQAGDILLLHGSHERIDALRNNPDLALLQQSKKDLPARIHAKRSLAIFCTMIALAISEILPIAIAALAGAGLMVLVGSIRLSVALRNIDFRLVFIIATSLALGTALELTGGAVYLAEKVIIGLLMGQGPAVLLSVHFLIVMIFTNLISNNACAVLFTPIGVHIALATGLDPHIFAIATLIAANCSFCTPIGYQTNLLVMGPGRYSFRDFLRLGTPLALLIWLSYSLIAPLWYGF
ncbi:SLC13 family permease [Aestuariispira insulae]|uniref:Di/tricarboxylate transporter n=1 Tax=Aestuariispira insulae TaxID=1461337 RepID=A0A3D9HPI2_9PROT|nr:SLC13 family permease [Aestuariispira insulae]RED51397.1 di/tricarboxylate transporter [Aestuariispira insulae]